MILSLNVSFLIVINPERISPESEIRGMGGNRQRLRVLLYISAAIDMRVSHSGTLTAQRGF